jgi:hypothetical protein
MTAPALTNLKRLAGMAYAIALARRRPASRDRLGDYVIAPVRASWRVNAIAFVGIWLLTRPEIGEYGVSATRGPGLLQCM